MAESGKADRGEYRIGVWGVDGKYHACLRVRRAGEKELRAVSTPAASYKTADEAETAMRERLPKNWGGGK